MIAYPYDDVHRQKVFSINEKGGTNREFLPRGAERKRSPVLTVVMITLTTVLVLMVGVLLGMALVMR